MDERDAYADVAHIFDFGADEPQQEEDNSGPIGKTPKQSQAYGKKTLAKGQYEQAIEHFKRALDLGGDKTELLADLGAAFEAAGFAPKAFQQFQKAQKLLKSGELAIALASVLKQQGKANEAIDHAKKAIEFEPHNAALHFQLATVLRHAGFRKAALEAIRKSTALEPEDPFFHYWMGDLALEMKLFTEAYDALHTAVELSPGDAQLFALGAVALRGVGKYPESIRAARLACDLDPDNNIYKGLIAHFEKLDGIELAREVNLDDYDRDVLGRLLKPLS